MSPLKLSDSELDQVFRAAAPLAPADRDAFLKAVAQRLSGLADVGPGAVYRACLEAQRCFLEYPVSQSGSWGKYR
jgi:hypothetical protein